MLLPYRVKNPPERFPVVTLSLIVANVIVYVFRTDSLLVIRNSVAASYGCALGRTPIYTFLTADFLHLNPLHLLGNMFFLWLFGPAVEGRLRPARFLIVYFAAGFCGTLLQGSAEMITLRQPMPGIGASGCIMGVLGAYLYLFSWSPVCVFYCVWWFWICYGVKEVAAIWVILLFLAMDLAQGLLYGSIGVSGGVANFAHVGGGAAGALLCLALRARRDDTFVSEAKAVQADLGDLSLMPIHALDTMLENDPTNPELIRALMKGSMSPDRQATIDKAMARAGPALIDADPGIVAYYLTAIRGNHNLYQPVHILHLAGLVERAQESSQALELYNSLVGNRPDSDEAEMALYRMANIYWDHLKDARNAQACLDEMLRRFPQGSLRPYAQTLRQSIRV